MSEFFLKIKLAIITGSEVQGLTLGDTADHTWSLAKSLSNQKDEWRGEPRREVTQYGQAGKKWGACVLRPVFKKLPRSLELMKKAQKDERMNNNKSRVLVKCSLVGHCLCLFCGPHGCHRNCG